MEAEIDSQVTYEQPGRPMAVGEIVLTPIARVTIRHDRVAGRVFFSGSKRPVAVLVRSGDHELRIDVPGA